MIQLFKTLADDIVIFIFLAIMGLAAIYLLIDWILGSRCPKCKKRGVRKISEVRIDDNSYVFTSKQYFVSYKCDKCGYSSFDNESRSDMTSG